MWPFRKKPQSNYAFIFLTQRRCAEHFIAKGMCPELADNGSERVARVLCHVLRIHWNDYRDAIVEAMRHV